MAGEQIVSKGCDLVFLQEVENDFFEPTWNFAAPKVVGAYDIFYCRRGAEAGGTAVLVRKGGKVAALADRPICIGGSPETGGLSKVTTVVPVRAGSKKLKAVSTHFTWNGAAEQRLHHAKLLDDALSTGTVVFGGDFNCEPGKHLEELEASCFLGRLQRAALPFGSATGLSSDFSVEEYIDHLYVSKDLSVSRVMALAKPGSPWGGESTRPAKVRAASDHVPVFMEVALGTPA